MTYLRWVGVNAHIFVDEWFGVVAALLGCDG